jgi:guanylate kinase
LIVILGGSASGKTITAKELMKLYGLKKIITYTSRPPRDGEIDGVDYHFVSIDKFKELKKQNFFAETGCYRGWYYGTPAKECTDDKILVVTPHGLRQLKSKKDLNITSFYIDVSRKDRLIKLLERDVDIDESCRRSLSDVGQFDGIEDEVDYVINNDGYKKTVNEITTVIMILAKTKDGVNE